MKKLHRKHKPTLDEQIEAEINKEVKEVKREWRQLLRFKDENQILFFAFVVLIIGLVVVNCVYIINRSHQASSNTTNKVVLIADTNKILTSQQTGRNSAESVRIGQVAEVTKPDPAFTLEEGQVLLVMNITITNRTPLSQHLIPVNQLYVRSSEGDYSQMHASSFVTNPIAAKDLRPGESASGQISFAVPRTVSNPLLYVDTGWSNVVPLVYDVLR